jgi:Domain of unknown function (DUF4878)
MRILALSLLSLLVIAGKSEAQTRASDPLEFYKGYLTVLAKAKSVDELVPYYTRELGDGLRKMPAEMQANYIKMNARALTDLKVTKQQVDPSKAVFEMSAKTADGRETTGTATLVKEGGAWKVEDESWAAPLPKTEGGT